MAENPSDQDLSPKGKQRTSPANDGSGELPAPKLDAAKIDAVSKGRKRTKTGCLTCRKRRIKCGEERPTCGNCVKSKRICEGYAPRLTFKDPLGAYTSWNQRGTGPIRSDLPASGSSQSSASWAAQSGPSQFPVIAPRPTPQHQQQATPPYDAYGPGSHHYHGAPQTPSQPHPYGTQPTSTSPIAYDTHPGQAGLHAQQAGAGSGHWTTDHSNSYANNHYTAAPTTRYQAPTTAAGTVPYTSDGVLDVSKLGRPESAYVPAFQAGTSTNLPLPYTDTSYLNTAADLMSANHGPTTTPISLQYGDTSQTPLSVTAQGHAHYMLAEEADDDYYDVNSDEDVPVPDSGNTERPEHDYGFMLALSASREDQALRSYYTFLHKPDILATYAPKFTASPLMDSTTARIFCHFITATAPYLSIFERHPVNPWVIFSGKPVPKSSQAVWTYILPMMALSNQSLLQSMLALASLQISRLQQTAPTASMRHYHFALKKVAKAVASPSKRTTIPILAATLLLGHFEATTAEHSKWSSHLAGARQLFMEVDFKNTARRIRKMKEQQDAEGGEVWYHQYVGHQFKNLKTELPWVPVSDGIDEQVVSQLMGWKIRYDEFGSVIGDEANDDSKTPLSDKDLDDFQVYRDLFWFFCKQDCIQSSISGHALLLPYHRWIHCPPRGPIGKIEAIYGTMDHLLLLMGRVCDFAHRDQVRKRKAMSANGGQWRPPPGMFPGPPPGSGVPGGPPSAPPGDMGGAGGPPSGFPRGPPSGGMGAPDEAQMFGMMPSSGPPKMPSAFYEAPRDQLYFPPEPNEDFELANATTDAQREWDDIQEALGTFEQCLGPDFSPLPEDAAPPINTPFGPAIQYRTYHIASIWSFFYTCKIIHARTHPGMHPAATVSAGILARATAEWTNSIGRIALGLQPPPPEQPLNPSFGAALTESMLSLFFAGVCYVDGQQRAATIQRLRLIAERVGTESAALIAAGLETVWIRMAEAGRGPPYDRTLSLTGDEVSLGRKITRRYAASTENNLVYVPENTRENWGSGIMSLEEDFDRMKLMKGN